jgi:hypothetical protein
MTLSHIAADAGGDDRGAGESEEDERRPRRWA